jgi:PAS domain-containing protein
MILPEIAQLALDYNPSPILVLNDTNAIIYANSAALAVLKRARVDLVEQQFLSLLIPEDREKGRLLLDAIRQGASTAVELAHVLGENQIVIEYRGIKADEDNTLIMFGQVVVKSDLLITRTNALNNRSSQLQAVLDSIDSGVLLVDRDGIVLYANMRLGELFGIDVTNWPDLPRAGLLKDQFKARVESEDVLWEFSGPPRRVFSLVHRPGKR